MITAYENMPLWHERDISHSSAERIILPDSTILLDYMLNRFSGIIENLTVFPDRMMENIQASHGLIFSQRVMLTLIEKGLTREEAYDRVQPLAMQAWETRSSFKELLSGSSAIMDVLTSQELDELFDLQHHLKHVDTLFKRVGLV
jgi:adenylosuccinate lyase